MPVQKYALTPDSPADLELAWEDDWQNINVRFKERDLGNIPNSKELKAGREFTLPNGSTLQLKLVSRFGFLSQAKLEISFDSIAAIGALKQQRKIPVATKK